MSKIDKKILEELGRYKSINKYINEQGINLADLPGGETPAAGGPPPAPTGDIPPPPGGAPTTGQEPTAGTPQTVDVENDPDVEKIDNKGESEEKKDKEGDSEELDITELVDAQKDNNEKQDTYFKELFGHLERLESKLSEMDNLVNKINSLEEKIEKSRPKTPQEKLELRSLDSGPYSQKLTDFFVDKEQDMQKSGKNEYVLTTDEVENFTPSDIRTSFNPDEEKNFGI